MLDHATAGAREIVQLFQIRAAKGFATLLAYCIAGHHSGLPDYGSVIDVEGEGTLLARLDPGKHKLEDYSAYKTEIDNSFFQPRIIKPIKGHRLFSILSDSHGLFHPGGCRLAGNRNIYERGQEATRGI